MQGIVIVVHEKAWLGHTLGTYSYMCAADWLGVANNSQRLVQFSRL